MNSESGQRLSLEELKRRNQPQAMRPQSTPMPPVHPARQEWDELLARLERLEASVGAQEALLRQISAQAGNCPTWEQMATLAQDVAQMRAELTQAGKRNEKRFSLPRPQLPHIPWTSLLLGLAILLLTGLVLWVVWSGLAALWSVVKLLIP